MQTTLGLSSLPRHSQTKPKHFPRARTLHLRRESPHASVPRHNDQDFSWTCLQALTPLCPKPCVTCTATTSHLSTWHGIRRMISWMIESCTCCTDWHLAALSAGVILSAPPCKEFSMLKLRRPGPKPLRTPDGLPSNRPAEQARVDASTEIHARSRTLFRAVLQAAGQGGFEQPPSAMSWHQHDNIDILREMAAHCAHVASCAHGWDLFKSWAFCASFQEISSIACVCKHPPTRALQGQNQAARTCHSLQRSTLHHWLSICQLAWPGIPPLWASRTQTSLTSHSSCQRSMFRDGPDCAIAQASTARQITLTKLQAACRRLWWPSSTG